MQTVGEIRAFAFGTTPNGWMSCNGALISITQYQVLYTLIGTMYGGDGKTTFGLPNLNGRVMVGSNGSQNGAYALGATGGAEYITLQEGQEAPHNHAFFVIESNDATALAAATNMPGDDSFLCNALFVVREPVGVMASFNIRDPKPQTALNPGSVQYSDGGTPHDNLQPYLTVNYCIATTGIYPFNQQ